MRVFLPSRLIILLAVLYLANGLARPAAAQPQRCFANGDVVSFDGVASPGRSPSQWVLNLARAVCIGDHDVSAVRIIGTPPPLGIPLELTGRLTLGRSAAQSTLFVALVVRSGRKVRTTENSAPLPPRAPAAPRETCNAPPYGGTVADYRAFVQRFANIIKPEKILAGVCNAKFGNAPRDGLHRLGLSDAKIDSESTEHLAAETIAALKDLVNTIE